MTGAWGAEGVTVKRGGKVLVDHVSVTLAPGRVTGILGPNGSGKTTLLRVLAGLDKPSAGTVAQGQTRGWAEPDWSRAVSCVLGVLAEDLPYCVEEVLLASQFPGARRWLDPSAERRRPLVELLERLEVFPDAVEGLDRTYATLSAGERQLVDLVRGVLQRAPVLLLDEPTSALDVRHRLLVRGLLANEAARGRVVALSLHDLAEARDGIDDVVVLHRGRLAAAGPSSVLNPELLAQVWGVVPDGPGFRLL
jgi:iron complex transport system ATP-binding protein